ncbi:hypothetical protein COV04_01085 [Candidatus Uhrbacteria bacterium CG10_big_fil_rev_8_21_14_0_10_48_11]|uniref:Uncharacterized protein n=1 Tax=Candidatus Uhrbacteria bacterium CG10_big_fil_rev_8_21_14_0_10_48_11 TaxID=1975037 RepID=A0A2M8LF85_9BACT|nr:MAG: hypothetical protein COV04_01085 [Candidatus Uhrbacteria bacterium CG10_big_fil_rev_8_21_14_0_10_48_11]
MRYLTASIVIISFIVVAVFGMLLAAEAMTNHHDCMTSTMTGNPCPENQLGELAHHFALLHTVSASRPWSLASLVLAVLSFFFVIVFLSAEASPPLSVFVFFSASNERHRFFTEPLLRWLTRFEHSPSL